MAQLGASVDEFVDPGVVALAREDVKHLAFGAPQPLLPRCAAGAPRGGDRPDDVAPPPARSPTRDLRRGAVLAPGTAVPQSGVAAGRLVGLYASRLQVLHAPRASGTIVQRAITRAAAPTDIDTVGEPSKRAAGARRSVAAPRSPSRKVPSTPIWTSAGTAMICQPSTIPIVVPREPSVEATPSASTSEAAVTSPRPRSARRSRGPLVRAPRRVRDASVR